MSLMKNFVKMCLDRVHVCRLPDFRHSVYSSSLSVIMQLIIKI